MFYINKMFKYPVKKKKKSLLSMFICLAVIYGGFQIIYFGEDYSPLQLLSSVENEATRLLRFMTQVQIHCNNSAATNNISQWLICQEPSLGMLPDLSNSKGIVYSVGPSLDYSFEYLLDKNSSYHLYIFSHTAHHPEFISNKTLFYKASIVPNDPADFGRNSYQTQTLNSIQESLHHKRIDILKIETLLDSVEVHELLHFLIEDSFLDKVKELHIVLQPDKVDEDYIYSWYRVLYFLFHKSGFRLYHTATSNKLCLHDIMESCKYYLSWLKSPSPQVFVLYPPAIDGSIGYEEDRLTDFLDESSSRVAKFLTVSVELSVARKRPPSASPTGHVMEISSKMSEKVLSKNAPPCTILFFLGVQYRYFKHNVATRNSLCSIFCLIPVYDSGLNSFHFINITSSSPSTKTIPSLSLIDINDLLKRSSTSILYIEEGRQAWDLIQFILTTEIPKMVDEIILKANVFQENSKHHPTILRHKYSILKQIEAFDMALVDYEDHKEKFLKFGDQQGWMSLNFIRKSFI